MEDWEEDIEDLKFEEVDDDYEEENDEEAEQEPPKEGRFSQFYNPIRAAFAEDNSLLEKFTLCQSHAERLSLLLGMEVVANSLAEIRSEREAVKGEAIPERPDTEHKLWKAPPKLSYGANKKYPHLSKALEVKFSKTEGRHIVAKQKILPGDVLMVDTPYIASLFPEHQDTHCHHCFRRLGEDCVPSPICDNVKFCRVECLGISYHETHKYEGGLLHIVDSPDIGRMATLAYRIVSKAGYERVTGAELESCEPSYTGLDTLADYAGVFRQADNLSARSIADHLKRTVTALLLTRCLQLSGWFPEHLQSDLVSQEVIQVAAIVAKHIQACSCNAYEINEFLRKGHSLIDCQNIELGGAVYPSISLSNHSCAANTSRTNYGRQGVVMATRTINTNEKVYDNYGHFYHTDPKETRQQVLAAQYFFPCSCLACKDDWPTYRDLTRRESDLLCYYCRYPIQDIIKKAKKCPRCKKELKPVVKIARELQLMHRDFRKIMDRINDSNAQENIKKYSKLLTEVEKVSANSD